jgi:hypothetical protein
VAYAAGRPAVEALRFLGVRSSQWAPQAATTSTAARAKEAERLTEHCQRVAARRLACAAEAEAAIMDSEGRGPGRRGGQPRLWRSHTLRYRVAEVRGPQKWRRRGRPPQGAAPQVEVRSRLVVESAAVIPAAEAHGWTVLATTLRPEEWTDAERLQAYQAQPVTVEPGLRWLKTPAAISPVWREQPERLAALALLTVLG